MKYLISTVNSKILNGVARCKGMLYDKSGDQITGWLIVVLLVVVTGALFLSLYQDGITEIWQSILDKMKSSFSL